MSLKEVLSSFKGKNYFEILGVSLDVNTAKLRSARRKLGATYHPDKFENAEDKAIAEKITAIVNEAFDAINNKEFVEKYIESGFRLKLTENNKVRVVKEITLSNNKEKGLTLTAPLFASVEDMIKGAKVEVVPTEVEGVEFAEPTIAVNIPVGTKYGSFLIYEGLGEKPKSGDNGDLIVSALQDSDINADIEPFVKINSDIPFINTSSGNPESKSGAKKFIYCGVGEKKYLIKK